MKIGRQIVIYDLVDLDTWLAERQHLSTSEYTSHSSQDL
jgi:hypothetical protein